MLDGIGFDGGTLSVRSINGGSFSMLVGGGDGGLIGTARGLRGR